MLAEEVGPHRAIVDVNFRPFGGLGLLMRKIEDPAEGHGSRQEVCRPQNGESADDHYFGIDKGLKKVFQPTFLWSSVAVEHHR